MASQIPGAWRSSIASRLIQRPRSVTGERFIFLLLGGPDMAPQPPPNVRGAPAEPWRPSISHLHHAGGAQALDLRWTQTEHAREDRVRVGAEHRRRARRLARRAVQADGH